MIINHKVRAEQMEKFVQIVYDRFIVITFYLSTATELSFNNTIVKFIKQLQIYVIRLSMRTFKAKILFAYYYISC